MFADLEIRGLPSQVAAASLGGLSLPATSRAIATGPERQTFTHVHFSSLENLNYGGQSLATGLEQSLAGTK